ncbi:uncharacterized protein LOC133325631 [Musca vetustissima]|uniref:uncharacterized protein LOC133325631 n=1 Tax=Musca vetustissima TaxID=27455 RepID=UPI002AB7487F|nr:uncharacterized protein LOC133325631 [Musca vetustissima]
MENGLHVLPPQTTPIIVSDYLTLTSPPTYSRLPPDGHEFPPNFSEPLIMPGGAANVMKTTSLMQSVMTTTTKGGNSDAVPPPLPKSTPPATVPRKVYRQDLVVNVEDAPSFSDSPDYKRSLSVPRRSSDWRKDEKSEKSVRDKIAMFSNDDAAQPLEPAAKPISFSRSNSSTKPLNLSTENLLDTSTSHTPYRAGSASLQKTRAMSVENLNDVARLYQLSKPLPAQSNFSDSLQSLNSINSDYTQSYASLPRRHASTQHLDRRISFSGQPAYVPDEASRKAAITNILEQRRRSLSKLRGLVIPDRPHVPLEPILDLPEIKSRDSDQMKASGNTSSTDSTDSGVGSVSGGVGGLNTIPRPAKRAEMSMTTNTTSSSSMMSSPLRPLNVSTHSNSVNIANNRGYLSQNNTSNSRHMAPSVAQRRMEALNTIPPAKPPRTSLVATPRQMLHEESDSCDSVFSSRISSPPMSPCVPQVPEKFALTRTLSSETNTSIASSTTSTLTSGSGSQATQTKFQSRSHPESTKVVAPISSQPVQPLSPQRAVEAISPLSKKSGDSSSSELSQWMHVEVAKSRTLNSSSYSRTPERTLKPVYEATTKTTFSSLSSKTTPKISTAEIREKFERTAAAQAANNINTTTISPLISTSSNINTSPTAPSMTAVN